MEPPYAAIFLLVAICGLAGVASIVKARRKRENTYYLITAVVFLMFLAVVVVLFNQFMLSFALIVVIGMLSIAILPKAMNLYRQEIVKQRQEADVSTPLSIRDFLTWKAWIKLKAIYGFRKMLLLYSLFNIGTIGAILITLTALGIINTVMALRTVILAGIVSVIIVYRQIWKAFKK